MIRFDSVSKAYPGSKLALDNVSFDLQAGEICFLTGHSGAGKSTLLKLIMMMERPSRGNVLYNGVNLSRLSQRHIPAYRRRIGVVFQDHSLLFDRTVFDNVALPLLVSGVPHREIARRVRAALDKVGLLKEEKYRPMQLSTGEQQRVGIARAVVHKPELLLADEPTGNLDPNLSEDIFKLFKDFNAVGVTMLIASHDLALVSRIPARRMALESGRLISV